jgi:hypothetical protein
MKPAIKVKGKVYTAKNHAKAIKKAKKDGQKVSMKDKEKIGKFKVGKKLLTRKQTKKKYGISHSHEL